MPTTQFDPGFVFKYGSRDNLEKVAYEGGAIIFCSNGEHFVDILGSRHRVSDVVVSYTQKQLEAIGKNLTAETDGSLTTDDSEDDINSSTEFFGPPLVYIANDTRKIYMYNTATKTMERLTVILAEAATNDSDGNNIVNTYETKVQSTSNFTETSHRLDELDAAIAAMPTFIVRVIDDGALPDKGEVGVIYFLPMRGTAKDTVYNTYIWDGDGKYYIKVGTSAVDLDNYTTLTKLSEELGLLKTELETKITNDKTALDAVDAALDKRMTTAEGNINNLKDVDTAYGKRLTDVEAKASTNEKNISNLQTLTSTHTKNITSLQNSVNAIQPHASGKIANINYNSYTSAATYHVTSNASSTNKPVNDAGMLYVAAADGNICQMYFTPTEFYRRYYNGSSWGGWRLVKEYALSGVNKDDYGFDG